MLSYMRQHLMPLPGSKIIVALSGGRDSVVLLHLLIKAGFRVEAAHMNFSLRGSESDEDERFVQDLAEQLGVTLHLKRVDARTYAQTEKISLQEAARILRYGWFDELVAHSGAEAVAVAHHLDDSIETTLINLLRGTGIAGLAGIRPVNGRIVRPLMFATSTEVEEFAVSEGLRWRDDSSNFKDNYLRNRIRHHLLPLLRTIAGETHGGLESSLELIFSQAGLYAELTEELRRNMLEKIEDGAYRIAISNLKMHQHTAAVLYQILASFGFNSKQVQQINQALVGQAGKVFLSSEYEVYLGRRYLEIHARTLSEISEHQVFPNPPENCPVEFEIIEWHAEKQISQDAAQAWLDFDTLRLPLSLRSPKIGDRFVPLGMKNSQLLSDFFTNNHFSRHARKKTLLLVDADGTIVWVCGHRIAHPYRIQPTTSKVLVVKLKSD